MSHHKKNREGLRRARGANRCQLVLRIVATDDTFNLHGGGWLGRCIHCGTGLYVDQNGQTTATVEHIRPIVAGGSCDELMNLALACSGCNSEKGIRHDSKRPSVRAEQVIEALLQKRADRWRNEAY